MGGSKSQQNQSRAYVLMCVRVLAIGAVSLLLVSQTLPRAKRDRGCSNLAQV